MFYSFAGIWVSDSGVSFQASGGLGLSSCGLNTVPPSWLNYGGPRASSSDMILITLGQLHGCYTQHLMYGIQLRFSSTFKVHLQNTGGSRVVLETAQPFSHLFNCITPQSVEELPGGLFVRFWAH